MEETITSMKRDKEPMSISSIQQNIHNSYYAIPC